MRTVVLKKSGNPGCVLNALSSSAVFPWENLLCIANKMLCNFVHFLIKFVID